MDYPIDDSGSQLHEGKFVDADPSQGIVASRDKADHQNALYDEVINVITMIGGLTPDVNNRGQMAAAIQAALDAITSTPIGTVDNAAKLGGKPASAYALVSALAGFLPVLGTAYNSNRLAGQPHSYYAKQSALASYLLKTGKAADSDKLDGKDSSKFAQIDGQGDIVARLFRTTYAAGTTQCNFFPGQVEAGPNSDNYMRLMTRETMLLALGFLASWFTNGWFEIPFAGRTLLVQWGTKNMNGGANIQTVAFNKSFSTKCFQVHTTSMEDTTQAEANVGRIKGAPSLSNFTISNAGGNTFTSYFWFAFGV